MSRTPAPTTSPWARRADSAVHGYGLYASKDIPKGTRIIEYVGDRITKSESDRRDEVRRARQEEGDDGCVYLFTLNKRYDIDGDVSWNTARLINHSCDPNCETEYAKGGIWISALRDIAKGEELNYDYGFDWDNFDEHPCRCGAPTCCGFIVSKDQRWRVRREIARRKAEKKGREFTTKKWKFRPEQNPMAKVRWGDLMQLKARLAGDPKHIRTLAVAESLTSGQIQARIGLISGASTFFHGGITAYSIDAKVNQLGVDRAAAEACNAVSEEIAIQMAKGVAQAMEADVGVATTGYAEPDEAGGVKRPFAHWAITLKGARGRWQVTTGLVKGRNLSRVAMEARVADKVIAALVKAVHPAGRESQA